MAISHIVPYTAIHKLILFYFFSFVTGWITH